MNQIVLKGDILDKIKAHEELAKQIASYLGITVRSLERLIYGNDAKLTQAGVLKILRDFLGIAQDKQLLAEIEIREVA